MPQHRHRLRHPVHDEMYTAQAMPKRALIIVDLQRDFMPEYGGPVQANGSARELVDGVNSLLNSGLFAVRVATLDNHPEVMI